MNILGINQIPGMLSWMHDSSSALVKNGKIVAIAEEERFNRVRHHRGYPHKSHAYCLKEGGISLNDVDYIAVPYNPYAFLKHPNLRLESLARNVFNMFACWHYKQQMKKQANAEVVYISHHLTHAASAYYCSGYDKANILTIDGSGETESFAFFVGENEKIRRVWDIPIASFFSGGKWQSIGLIYTSVTSLLNLGVNGEGKTMGLASYGKPEYDFSDILNIRTHNDFTIDRRKLLEKYGHLQRKENGPITQEHKNLAASLQHALEKSVVNLAKEAFEYSGIKNFCLAGGVTLNCNTNSELLKQDFCDSIFIQPAANDGGIALGAALEQSARAGDPVGQKLENAYFGPGFDNKYIENVLSGAKVKYRRAKNIAQETAQLITQGKIVAWFQGRMEMGPRALGNRSILADPTREGIADSVNNSVKHREAWRPFAPSVAEEDASKYFQGVEKLKSSPFMLHTFFVRDEYQSKLPAITHVDGSSRIQTVRADQNEKYYNLIKEIENINGYAIVLNTSFNDKGEPIICTPQDALRCFFATGLDALAIGDFIVEK
ncbi:MAG: hypothetical protein CO042_04090 [Parcubacteria group bacterium CG_4_9_14_0_2_um_filter_41_8]|nr:MAG: hypothetical protein COY02_03630 [Parcubacteria group bacterium CG_4_10_14_0_2_um_filter_41_6]PJC40377.1 MAG: hypothetical protein CO042_04090 [Parcubacteria group bacterium CG_4_9_14_0_2_um_filter_41_8]